jgi:hypothetical protein
VVGRSLNAAAANRIVKSACVWTSSDARPGGRPLAIAKNWSRNWPVKSVSPTAISFGHGSRGRGRTSAGTAAIRKRRAVSWGGEKLSRAIRVATKPSPQMTTTRSVRAT